MGESKDRGRRLRGRKKVQYDEVQPSSDLPPLVQGDLRCFLCVDVGKIVWSSTTTAQVPPASPAIVRLRWWGEPSEGTYFKPSSGKSERVIKSRAKYGVRSGAKQITAYFVDMGSFVFEVMTSPRSVPIGKIQIPRASQLSMETPIRGLFPIISASSRKVGELQLNMHFKPLHAAYDTNTDTDTSISTRGSRPPSTIGRRSRSRGSSAGSAKSRSSSRGSRKGRKKSSNGPRSRSRESSTSSRRSSVVRTIASSDVGHTVTSSTPRGVDEMLQRNGRDLYRIHDDSTPKKSLASKKTTPKKKTKIKKSPTKTRTEVDSSSSNNQDIISALLNKGNELRDALVRSEFVSPLKSRVKSPVVVKSPVQRMTPKQVVSEPVHQLPKPVLKPHRSNLDLRFVDLMLGADQQQSFVSTPPLVSPVSSMLSEFEGNPLHDNTLLEQMFYNNESLPPTMRHTAYKPTTRFHNKENDNPNIRPADDMRKQATYKAAEKPCEEDEGLSDEILERLEDVECARVLINTLHLTSLMHEEDNAVTTGGMKKGKKRRGRKPPMPSPGKKQGTYFVEYRFPASIEPRQYKTSTVTHDDITRIASRKTAQGGTVVIFDQHAIFPLEFDTSTLKHWMHDDLKFFIYYKKTTDKKPCQLGQATVPLVSILQSHDFVFRSNAPITDQGLSARSCGTMQVCVELTGNVKDISSHFSPQKKRTYNNEYVVTRNGAEGTIVSDDESCDVTATRSDEDEAPWYQAIAPLQLIIMLHEGKDIPGTTTYSSESGVSNHPPNVYLVCRSSFSPKKPRTGVVWSQTNPQFNFAQTHVVTLDDDVLEKMQGGYIVIEVWMKMMKQQSDKLIGLVKAPTQMFFHKLNNQQSARDCIASSYPIMAVDRFLSVVDVFSGQTRGQINMTVALGTQDQINLMKKLKMKLLDNILVEDHHLQPPVTEDDTLPLATGPVQHTFKVEVIKIHGFKPSDNQVWGETDCFIQYSFPKQMKGSDDEDVDCNQNLASMHSYRSDTTLCVPNPAFNQARNHVFSPPLHVPVHRLLMMAISESGNPENERNSGNIGGIPFEVWSRFYYPNVRDQLVAKGWLPIAKLCALVTMTTNKTAQQTFVVPLDCTLSDGQPSSAGQIEVKVTYTMSGTTMEHMQPAAPFTKPCILKVAVERACGLKAAAKLLANHEFGSEEMKHHSDVGVNCYATISSSFMPDQDLRTTRVIARTFTPEFQHHIELACPLVSYQQDVTTISLAELLHTGEIEFKFYHKPSQSSERQQDALGAAVLLGTVSLPLKALLYKTTGLSGWFSIKSGLSASLNQTTVGAVELSVTFTTRNDLDLILRAAVSTGWKLPVNEARLLTSGNSDVIIDRGNDQLSTNHVTVSITITNAWLAKHDIIMPGRQSIDRKANVYVRYKFYDADSVVSSLCPIYSSENNKSDKKVAAGRIAHKQTFTCKITDPFMWYLREEKLTVQMWLTHSTSSKSRPVDSDKLLGTCFIDLTELIVGGLSKPQNISGVHELYMAGSDDLGGGCCRVYVSMTPGTHHQMQNIDIPLSLPTKTSSSDSCNHDSDNSSCDDEDSLDPNSFKTTITIERAMHLSASSSSSASSPVKPNCYVTFQCVELAENKRKSVTKSTRIIKGSSSPTWMNKQEVRIPKQYLGSTGMIFKLWHRDVLFIDEGVDAIVAGSHNDADSETRQMASDVMLGFATVDLSVLSAGLLDINGWYNLLDLHGQCQGQIKIAVTPHSVCEVREIVQKVEKVKTSIKPKLQTAKIYNIQTSNFLHSVPIAGPVQTPSGSLYYPGIHNSAQTVGITCKMDEPSTSFPEILQSKVTLPTSVPTIPLFQAANHAVNSSFVTQQNQGPTRSMIYYNNLDRNQQCLFQTLQKQIAELENIKSNFEKRRANDFADEQSKIVRNQEKEATESMTLPVSESPPLVQNEEAEDTLSFKAQDDEEQEQILVNATAPLATSVQTAPQDHKYEKTVDIRDDDGHVEDDLALGNVNDESAINQFNDEVPSDHEMESDIELIQPQSLNTSINFDQCLSPRTSESGKFRRSEETDDQYLQRIESLKDLHQTPHLSECHSALDDTSVWMTSTSRISELSEEDDKEEHEDNNESFHEETVSNPIEESDEDKLVTEDKRSQDQTKPPEEEKKSSFSPTKSSSHLSEDETSEQDDHSVSTENKIETPIPSQGKFSSNPSENEIVEDVKKDEDWDVAEGKKTLESSENDVTTIPKDSPQFFPPIKDLETQMRAVQAETTEHQHKLRREQGQDFEYDVKNDDESGSSPTLRSKRIPMRKDNLRFSSEQTQRLQRIFKTKFSNK